VIDYHLHTQRSAEPILIIEDFIMMAIRLLALASTTGITSPAKFSLSNTAVPPILVVTTLSDENDPNDGKTSLREATSGLARSQPRPFFPSPGRRCWAGSALGLHPLLHTWTGQEPATHARVGSGIGH
jgi:hypothetical protein